MSLHLGGPEALRYFLPTVPRALDFPIPTEHETPLAKARRQKSRANGHFGVAYLNPLSPGMSPVRPALLLISGKNLLTLFRETSLQTLKDGQVEGLLKSSELNRPSPSYDVAYSHAAHQSPFCGLLVNISKYESQNWKGSPGMINT